MVKYKESFSNSHEDHKLFYHQMLRLSIETCLLLSNKICVFSIQIQTTIITAIKKITLSGIVQFNNFHRSPSKTKGEKDF